MFKFFNFIEYCNCRTRYVIYNAVREYELESSKISHCPYCGSNEVHTSMYTHTEDNCAKDDFSGCWREGHVTCFDCDMCGPHVFDYYHNMVEAKKHAIRCWNDLCLGLRPTC